MVIDAKRILADQIAREFVNRRRDRRLAMFDGRLADAARASVGGAKPPRPSSTPSSGYLFY